MKNLKIVFTLALVAMLCMPGMAQKATKKAKKEFISSVTQLDADKQKQIVDYARSLEKVDTKKALAKAYKKLSAEDRQKLMSYAAKVKAPKMQAPVAPKKPRVNMKEGVAKKPKKAGKGKIAAAPKGPLTKVEVLEATHDFGVINQGEKAQHVYKIKNVGDSPLIISKAKGSCGCTVPKWPKDPIAPGEMAEIDVVFNSRGKRGKQNKRITITANTDPVSTILTIKGEVKTDANAAPKKGAKKPASPPVKE